MKQIVHQIPKQTVISLADVLAPEYAPEKKYFGVEIKRPSSPKRGFIIKYPENATVICPKLMTDGNTWCASDSDTVKGVIQNSLARGWHVFEFDSFIELMTWVSDDNFEEL